LDTPQLYFVKRPGTTDDVADCHISGDDPNFGRGEIVHRADINNKTQYLGINSLPTLSQATQGYLEIGKHLELCEKLPFGGVDTCRSSMWRLLCRGAECGWQPPSKKMLPDRLKLEYLEFFRDDPYFKFVFWNTDSGEPCDLVFPHNGPGNDRGCYKNGRCYSAVKMNEGDTDNLKPFLEGLNAIDAAEIFRWSMCKLFEEGKVARWQTRIKQDLTPKTGD
jgi:hypothetical protein